jgi:hypothetical protein
MAGAQYFVAKPGLDKESQSDLLGMSAFFLSLAVALTLNMQARHKVPFLRCFESDWATRKILKSHYKNCREYRKDQQNGPAARSPGGSSRSGSSDAGDHVPQ